MEIQRAATTIETTVDSVTVIIIRD